MSFADGGEPLSLADVAARAEAAAATEAAEDAAREAKIASIVQEAFTDAACEVHHGRSPERHKTYTAWPLSAPMGVAQQATKGREARAHRKEFPRQACLPTDAFYASVYRLALSLGRAAARERVGGSVWEERAVANAKEANGLLSRAKARQQRAELGNQYHLTVPPSPPVEPEQQTKLQPSLPAVPAPVRAARQIVAHPDWQKPAAKVSPYRDTSEK